MFGIGDDDDFFGKGTVNYRGDKFTQDLYNQLANLGSGAAKTGGVAGGRTAMLDAFNNWLTGGRPAAVDIGVTLARSAALAGVKERAAAGSGFAGAFGLGKILGFGLPSPTLAGYSATSSPGSPMQAGTPYSVPPIPDLMPKGPR